MQWHHEVLQPGAPADPAADAAQLGLGRLVPSGNPEAEEARRRRLLRRSSDSPAAGDSVEHKPQLPVAPTLYDNPNAPSSYDLTGAPRTSAVPSPAGSYAWATAPPPGAARAAGWQNVRPPMQQNTGILRPTPTSPTRVPSQMPHGSPGLHPHQQQFGARMQQQPSGAFQLFPQGCMHGALPPQVQGHMYGGSPPQVQW